MGTLAKTLWNSLSLKSHPKSADEGCNIDNQEVPKRFEPRMLGSHCGFPASCKICGVWWVRRYLCVFLDGLVYVGFYWRRDHMDFMYPHWGHQKRFGLHITYMAVNRTFRPRTMKNNRVTKKSLHSCRKSGRINSLAWRPGCAKFTVQGCKNKIWNHPYMFTTKRGQHT